MRRKGSQGNRVLCVVHPLRPVHLLEFLKKGDAVKTYRSSSFAFEFTGTRAAAIKACIEYLNSLGVNGVSSGNYAWRADDDSGFRIAITVNLTGIYAEVHSRWNAVRNS